MMRSGSDCCGSEACQYGKTLFRSVGNANQSNNAIGGRDKGISVKTRLFLGQIRCTKQILGVGQRAQGGPSASCYFPLLLFSSVPSFDVGERGQNNGFCGDTAGFLLDTWLEEPRRASYGGSS